MTTILNIKIDPKIKMKAKKIAEEFGISLSAMVNASLREVIRTKTLYLNANEEKPYRSLIAAIKSAERDERNGKTINFSSGQEALKFLDTLKKK